jgi:histidine triad (HIT) family protein
MSNETEGFAEPDGDIAAALGAALAEPACVFCDRIQAGEYDVEPRRGCYVFPPLNPVTPGHLLVVPGEHVRDAAAAPATAAAVMHQAALIVQRAGGNANIITSIGPAATQTVMHLHVHVVPRREGDGLALPWTGQKKLEAAS